MPEVLNIRVVGKAPHPDRVVIDRSSKWGNRYIIGPDGNREEVVEMHRKDLEDSPLMDDIEELRGKDLICWCAPKACHGDTLLELANR